ncbi:predicted protein [Botrytis cinerea T4]|uniref:Uncharacterized protein n=1 Tax=Botryotinia fuckeliana (strain T4) TaxID=999810 RepID=G2XVM1_BOTF4|nr:predicted protein [Botrytis cinerea T4]
MKCIDGLGILSDLSKRSTSTYFFNWTKHGHISFHKGLLLLSRHQVLYYSAT